MEFVNIVCYIRAVQKCNVKVLSIRKIKCHIHISVTVDSGRGGHFFFFFSPTLAFLFPSPFMSFR